ncbi:unnamed protein product [Symbiodinium pilosum]|uniref:Uncharacterized protein n=1 Tax=Symbiodinium pilosum TaxID=2952 RepID=A0A812MRW0_SYMPI|nr:unnamed protein product [Symbiodinium pilosum]
MQSIKSVLRNMQCAEIYGHVDWLQVCDCVDEATGLRDNITVAAPRLGTANIYFSVPAFVVLFRESLEARLDCYDLPSMCCCTKDVACWIISRGHHLVTYHHTGKRERFHAEVTTSLRTTLWIP